MNSSYKHILDNVSKKVVDSSNPFLLTYPGGIPMVFRQDHECYYYVMTSAIRFCNKGYIELPYFIHCLYPDFTLGMVRSISSAMVALKVPYVEILDFGKVSCFNYFEHFFLALHSVTDTKFNKDAFKTACGLSLNTFELLSIHKN